MVTSIFDSNPFYHAIIRKAIVAFGQTFTGMQLRHYDTAGNIAKVVKVPIAYAPKEKWFTRLSEDPDFRQKFQIELPRLSFEIISMNYDAERKIGKQHEYILNRCPANAGKIYAPVPWNITISLSSYTRTQEDSLQILEQILPFFGPALVMNLDILEMNITQDVPVTLENVQRQDTYQGNVEEERMITQDFIFEMKLNLYGPTESNVNVIKTAMANFKNLDGSKIEDYSAAVTPSTANKTDVFTITENWI